MTSMRYWQRRIASSPSVTLEGPRKIPEFPDLPHRELLVPPYRFFYRPVGETVWIVAVWHGAQIPAPPPNPNTGR